jgi:FlaA1/EpsC-like NDP-sugar epimerase
VLLLYAASALFGLFAVLSRHLALEVVLALATLLFLGMAAFGVYLGMVQVYPAAPDGSGRNSGKRAGKTFIGGTFPYKKQLAQVGVDLLLVPLAFLCANLLRFEGHIPPEVIGRMVDALPYLIVAKSMAMVFFNTYAGVQRYAGLPEVVAVLRGSTVGTLLATLMLWRAFAFQDISRASLITDWMIFTGLAIASRLGLVLLEYLFGTVSPPDARRLVVVGANAAGLAAARELRKPASGAQPGRAIGFVDDDDSICERKVGGLPVFGTIQDLPQVVEREQADAVVIALPSRVEAAHRAAALCGQHNIPHIQWLIWPDRSTS